MTGEGQPPLQGGAEAYASAPGGTTNRDRVLDAAARVFATEGLGASVPAIASAAGVGVGTIYRAFESKSDLIGALVADRIDWVAEQAAVAVRAPESWPALVDLLWRTAERQAADRVTAEGLAATYEHPKVLAARERAGVALTALFERAHADGGLRPDFTPADMQMFFAALAAAQHSTPRGSDAWKRLMGVLVDGLRPEAATPFVSEPLRPEEIGQAFEEERARRSS
ncbi:MAG: hypothetical protein QOJ07_1053 [Thermoleophilaceae bacterium]|nr:hypothetical protein [Thermoleophilaceae bacterium]